MGLKQILTGTLLVGSLVLFGKGAYDLTTPPETGTRVIQETRTYNSNDMNAYWTKLSKAESAIFEANSGLYNTVSKMTPSTVPLEYGVLRVFEQITAAKSGLEASMDDGLVFNDEQSRQMYEATVSKAVSDLNSAHLKLFRATGTYAPIMLPTGDTAYVQKLIEQKFMDVGPANNAKLKEAYNEVGQSLVGILSRLSAVYPVSYEIEKQQNLTFERDPLTAQKDFGLAIAAGAAGLALALKRNNARGYMPGL